MIVKGFPMIAVSKVETALENKDGTEISMLYEKYCSIDKRNVFTRNTWYAVYNCLFDWSNEVANDFNEKFQNFETQSEMDNYLKENYGTIFFKNESNSELLECEAFGELYSLRESKIECLNTKTQLDKMLQEGEETIKDVKNKISMIDTFSNDTEGNAVISERTYESLMNDASLDYLNAGLDIEKYIIQSYQDESPNSVIINYDKTYEKLAEYSEEKITAMQSEIAKLQAEVDEY
jgi:hypothetical protein